MVRRRIPHQFNALQRLQRANETPEEKIARRRKRNLANRLRREAASKSSVMRDAVMPVAVSPVKIDVPMDIDDSQNEQKFPKPLQNGINGHIKSEEGKYMKLIFTDSRGKNLNLDIITECEKLSSLDVKKPNSNLVNETKEITKQFKEIKHSMELHTSQISDFLKAKHFLFHTPIPTIRNHPQFSVLYSNLINEDTSKSSLQSPLNEIQAKVDPDECLVLTAIPKAKINLPPLGEFVRKELTLGAKYYVMKHNQVGEFGIGTILSIRDAVPDRLYKVRLENSKTNTMKLFTAKQLAYMKPPEVIVPVGTRICARYCDGIRSAVYAGIIAEPPQTHNKSRYLIFFDDGYAQYIGHQDIFVMCAQSVDVAEDVHDNLKEFIKSYLQKFPERPMVKLQQNQITKTEYECRWWDTKVLDIDSSMVKMYFIDSQRTEWIYRGSTRLKLLFDELHNAEEHRRTGKNRRHNIVPRKPHQPYVEYTREEEVVTIDSDDSDSENVAVVKQYQHPRRKTGGAQFAKNDSEKKIVKNTARKSTSTTSSKPRSAICNLPLKYRAPDIKSHLGFKETHCRLTYNSIAYKIHKCGPACREKESPSKLKGKNPLLIPIYLGWEREVRKFYRKEKKGNRFKVMYRAACGKTLRSLSEIQNYLIQTSSQIQIDYFSLDPMLLVFRTFRAKEVLYEIQDVTQGNENVPVSCINSWSNEPPPFVEYESERFPGKNVDLNLDPEFLCGCSCTDNCQDPSKCECQQITNYAKSAGKGEPAGYKFRRLKEPIITGLYECNQRCKCSSQCGNRVVQNGLQVRLQMFKTERKGWGIRCLDDLDAGQFICIYAGQLLTDQGADEDGNQFGDEYLAELDHIEVAEMTKEGYESDVEDIEEQIHEEANDKNGNGTDDSDDDPNDPDASFSSEDVDSDFEPNLRNSAITSLSTRGNKKIKLSSSSSSLIEDSRSHKDKKGLPDISNSIDSLTIVPQPLSPESAEFLEKIELTRTPKLPDDVTNGKSIAKKSLNAKSTTPLKVTKQKEVKYRTIRSYYNEESCYIMDAKSKGNIGRYLNHSCAPNVFVQNVFTDTHDLRFPAIAFFAMHYILAGTELTWDYNYEVGSVVDKVMYCYCDSRTCRGRLL